MNKIHRLIWNHLTQCWVAVAECARGRGKGNSRRLVAAALSLTAVGALAAPLGGQVTAGFGSVTQSGTTTTILQSSPTLSLNWKSFNLAATDTVKFVQPTASSVAVNRIADTNASQILGKLSANGQVYLINPNGLLFGQSAVVNVGGLVASTLGIKDTQLNTASRTFASAGAGSVSNQGAITAAQGGYVALLANTVSNTGTLTAPMGTVALGAGSTSTLTCNSNQLVGMQIDKSVLNTLAANGGLVKADGGRVIMSAGAKNEALASVVNNTGIIQARTVSRQGGSIILLGGMAAGTVTVGGTLDASAPQGGNGGFIETSAAQVNIADKVKITTAAASGKTGNWLIDPVDFTIAATGGNLTGAALGTLLSTNSVTVQTLAGTNTASNVYSATAGAGDINVNDTVSWSANTLTLKADQNIRINATLNATGSGATAAKLALQYGQATTDGLGADYFVKAAVNLAAGDNFSTQQGSAASIKTFTVITQLGVATDASSTTPTTPFTQTLQGMAAGINLAKNFVLGQNIDATATSTATGFAATGFVPIGSAAGAFSGTFDGLGHTINLLTINNPGVANMGLFGAIATGTVIQNIGLTAGSVLGGIGSGGLVGSVLAANTGVIKNSYNTGTVTSTATAGTGGLVGNVNTGSVTISDSYATGDVIGGAGTGGLVGQGTTGAITISNSYAKGNISGGAGVGGLVGGTTTGQILIEASYAEGTVSGAEGAGGLVGYATTGTITVNNSHALGNISGAGSVGGVVGGLTAGAALISASFAAGTVTGAGPNVGGLAGNSGTGTVSNSYALGAVTNSGSSTGGLVGSTTGDVTDSYAKGNVSGGPMTGGLVGSSTGAISKSYSEGSVVGGASTGGLLGSGTGNISISYATGAVTGGAATGGLMGTGTGNLTNSYATGDVSGGASTGGLMGTGTGLISSSYSSGAVTGTAPGSAHGLTGTSTQVPVDSYWNTTKNSDPTKVSANTMGTGLSSADMLLAISYPNMSTAVWRMDGTTMPILIDLIKTVQVTASNVTKTYDGAAFSGGSVTYSGALPGVPLGVLAYSGTSQGAVNVGSDYAITPGGQTFLNPQYKFNYVNGTLNITAAVVDIGGGGGTGGGGETGGGGTGGGGTGTGTGTASAISMAGSRVYDGTNIVAANIFTLSGLLNGDTLGLTGAGTVATKNVGVDKAVTLGSLSLTNSTSGTGLASNYTFVGGTYKATITARPLTITAASTGSKTYDGTTTAAVALSSNALASDTLVLGMGPNTSVCACTVGVSTFLGSLLASPKTAANFSDKNVGVNKTILVTGLKATGLDASNYTLTSTTASTTGDITSKAITVTAVGKNKVYDANASELVTLSSSGMALGDRLTMSSTTASFDAGKDVGVGKAVSVSGISLSGLDAGNYTLNNTSATTSANITPKVLLATAVAANRVYDGTLADTFTLTSTGVLSGETVGLSNTSAGFATKTAGTAKAFTVSGITLTGSDKGNYSVNSSATTTATIAPKLITVSAAGVNKVYDATLIDAVTLSGTGVLLGDSVSYTKTSALFANKNVGTAKTVTVSGIRLSGLDAANYTSNKTATTQANITAKAITISALGKNKVYDGTLSDAVTLRASGIISGDAFGLSSTSALFQNKNVGVSKTVAVSGLALTGVNAANYSFNTVATTTATITPKVIVVGAVGISRAYDGTLNDNVTLSSTGILLGDTVLLSKTSALFATKTIGVGKTVSVSGISLSGLDAGNYRSNTTATTKASITAP